MCRNLTTPFLCKRSTHLVSLSKLQLYFACDVVAEECMKMYVFKDMINLPFACTNCLDLCLNIFSKARAMTYSSTSVLPVLLTILLLVLDHTSEGIEYHVKPTDPEVTQCPGQPCQTLAEYSTWDFFSCQVCIQPNSAW